MSKWTAFFLKNQVLSFLQNLVPVNILNKAFKLLVHNDLWILKLLTMIDLQKWKKSLDDLVKSFYFTDEGTEIQRSKERVSGHVTGYRQGCNSGLSLPAQWVIW